MMDLAVIGGTGVYALDGLEAAESIRLEPPFGGRAVELVRGFWHGRAVVFLARHGAGHTILPHEIDYRANLWALAMASPRRIVALNTVGSLDDRLPPGAIGVPDQLIDYTWGRASTFNGLDLGPAFDIPLHVDLTEPYDADVRRGLIAAGGDQLGASSDLVYAATQGPRLETAAEIRRLRRDGCGVVGMTGMPEAALARELGLPYACLCIVANWAAGYHPDAGEITMEEVVAVVEQASAQAWRVLERFVELG